MTKKPTVLREDTAERLSNAKFAAAYQERRYIHEIALAVRRMREAAGLTQEQLASLVGTSQPNIARLEKSLHHTPQWPILYRIAAALGCQLQINFVQTEKEVPLVRTPARLKKLPIAPTIDQPAK